MTVVFTPPPRCAFPGCEEFAGHTHHITYVPEVTKGLCVRHHEEITILNGQQGRKYRSPLSNKFRWWIWFQWTRGKIKLRRTRKSLEWVDEWRASSSSANVTDETPRFQEPQETEAGKKVESLRTRESIPGATKVTPRQKRKKSARSRCR